MCSLRPLWVRKIIQTFLGKRSWKTYVTLKLVSRHQRRHPGKKKSWNQHRLRQRSSLSVWLGGDFLNCYQNELDSLMDSFGCKDMHRLLSVDERDILTYILYVSLEEFISPDCFITFLRFQVIIFYNLSSFRHPFHSFRLSCVHILDI